MPVNVPVLSLPASASPAASVTGLSFPGSDSAPPRTRLSIPCTTRSGYHGCPLRTSLITRPSGSQHADRRA